MNDRCKTVKCYKLCPQFAQVVALFLAACVWLCAGRSDSERFSDTALVHFAMLCFHLQEQGPFLDVKGTLEELEEETLK